jgi:hypothetical protein
VGRGSVAVTGLCFFFSFFFELSPSLFPPISALRQHLHHSFLAGDPRHWPASRLRLGSGVARALLHFHITVADLFHCYRVLVDTPAIPCAC